MSNIKITLQKTETKRLGDFNLHEVAYGPDGQLVNDPVGAIVTALGGPDATVTRVKTDG